MKMHRRAARRFFNHGAIPALAAAMLLTAALPGGAQQRQRPSDSGSSGRSVGSSGGGSSSSSGGSKGGSVSPSRPSSSAPSTPSTRNTGSPERPRTAQPAGPGGGSEPRRQPPHRVGGGGGGGHHHGGGFHGGGYYGGYYRHYDSFYFWPWYTPYWYYGPHGYYQPYRDRGYVDRDTLGALDLDISPGRAEVYLDGQNLGIVDKFDGFPQYLWLEKGTYDLVFYREGYQTQARQVSVHPGLVISVDGRLERGESVRPQDLGPKTHDRRDARIRDEQERRERIESGEGSREWRDRVRGDRERWRDDDERGEDDDHGDRRRSASEDDEDDDGRRSASRDGGWLRLDVDPADASVYVDGKFVGTGAEIAEMRSGLRLTPGRHKLAVVRPGHKAEETSFEVEAGESVELEIELDSYE